MPGLAAVPDLERELDALYTLPLEEFTKARNDLAARLRRAHQAEKADVVKALRKPSLVAWAANRLARERPRQLTDLLEAGVQLRETQQQALRGRAGGAEVGDASAAEREALHALLAAARPLLGGRATPQLLERLARTLRAAAVDDEAAALLRRGRLTEELEAVGFGPLEPVTPQRRPRDEVTRVARERVATLRAEARRAAGDARAAEEAAAAADREAAARRAEAEEKRVRAEEAATVLAAAEADLRERR